MKKLRFATFLISLSIFIWKVDASTFSLYEMEPILAAHHSTSGIVVAGLVGSLWNSFQKGMKSHNNKNTRETSEESNREYHHSLKYVDPSYESNMEANRSNDEEDKETPDDLQEYATTPKETMEMEANSIEANSTIQEKPEEANSTIQEKPEEANSTIQEKPEEANSTIQENPAEASNSTLEQKSKESDTNTTSLPEVSTEMNNNTQIPNPINITSVVLNKDISSSHMLDQMLKNQFDSLPKNCFKLPDNYEKPSLEVFKNCTEKCGPESLKSCLCEIICVQKKVEMAHSLCKNCESKSNYNVSSSN